MLARCLVASVLALATFGTPTTAARLVPIGMGEQQPSMFTDPRWHRLGLTDVRYLAPWDVLDRRRQLAELDAWMAAAAASGARVTLSFRRSHKRHRAVPSPAAFLRAFLGLRERFPQTKAWIIWNEANHPASGTEHHPGQVARLFDVAAANCPGCRIVGADVLDRAGMTAWVRAFRRHARERPLIWGLHNYHGARLHSSVGTRALLGATRGAVWFTETGQPLLRRRHRNGRHPEGIRRSPRTVAKDVRYALQLACVSKRIKRVYLYNWQAPWFVTGWDSGFIGPRGRPRPAYEMLLRHVRANGPYMHCG